MSAERGAAPAERAIVIGGSAGSLEALTAILEGLPAGAPLAIVLVVHLPREGGGSLALALRAQSPLPVREPDDKEPVAPGVVWVAPPGYHLLIDAGPAFAYSTEPPVRFALPSIDVLFESAARVFGARVTGVILSGANDDGARGLAAICRTGGRAFVQARASAPSPEMPGAALTACPAAEELPPDVLAARIAQLGDADCGAPGQGRP